MADNLTTTVSSKSQTVEINRSNPTVIIGERINPTGRKKLQAALQEGNFEIVRSDAIAQVEAGAAILDVNAGVPGANEPELLKRVMGEVIAVTDTPLCIDTADPEALAAALSVYEGKALVNSVNGEERSLGAVLPVAKEHNAAVIGLCMDDNGIPETPEQRLAVADKIIERAPQRGQDRAGNHRLGGREVRRQHHNGGQQHLVWHARPQVHQRHLHCDGDPERADLPNHQPIGRTGRDRGEGRRPVDGSGRIRDGLDQGLPRPRAEKRQRLITREHGWATRPAHMTIHLKNG
ncbi:MAG: dihydropteroate synthase [Chloroflexota bacterium]